MVFHDCLRNIWIFTCVCLVFAEKHTRYDDPADIEKDRDTKLRCSLEEQQFVTLCKFAHIHETSDDYDWEPENSYPRAIYGLTFEHSTLRVVTNIFCKKRNELRLIHLSYTNVEEITHDAFEECRLLSQLLLTSNKIKTLHQHIFSSNPNLQILHLESNQLQNLDFSLSSLEHLYELNIGNNYLTELSPDIFEKTKTLKQISIFSNNLADLDVENIVKNLPRLDQIHMDDNEISCVRLGEIFRVFQKSGITYNETTYDFKKRYYDQTTIDNNQKCNPDISWLVSTYKIGNVLLDEAVHDVYTMQISNDNHVLKMKYDVEKKFNEIFMKMKIFDCI